MEKIEILRLTRTSGESTEWNNTHTRKDDTCMWMHICMYIHVHVCVLSNMCIYVYLICLLMCVYL